MTQEQKDYIIANHEKEDVLTMAKSLMIAYNKVYCYCSHHKITMKRSSASKRPQTRVPKAEPKAGFFNVDMAADWMIGGSNKITAHRKQA